MLTVGDFMRQAEAGDEFAMQRFNDDVAHGYRVHIDSGLTTVSALCMRGDINRYDWDVPLAPMVTCLLCLAGELDNLRRWRRPK